ANIGTCVTAWMLGVPEMSRFLYIAALGGAALVLCLQGWAVSRGRMRKKGMSTNEDGSGAKDVAGILLGLALLFLGMDGMQAGTAVLAESRTFQQFLMNCSNPLQGVFAGAAATAVLQSSSVSVGILQALSAGGVMRYETAVPVILGQNIGTCVTALLACIGVGARGRVAAAVHLVFNVVGTGIFLFGFYGLHRILEFSFMGRSVGSVGIALIHTVFNLATTAVLLPMLYMYSWGEGQKKRLNSKRVREFSRSVMR
ncbi:MAG: Na/Pi cotransporter family protein, partial [Lachnospiraceae bacterium]|nr:Na/Pi cotransporter family protein [Lachnospiraceae bacterium]